MKTILALSDTHGDRAAVLSLQDRFAGADYVVHLGDFARDLSMPVSQTCGEEACRMPELITVNGNCDGTAGIDERVLTVEGVGILLTHGHRYGVKHDLTRLFCRMEELGVTYALFGHTHAAEIYTEGGLTAINPGSLSRPAFGEPSYAYLTLYQGKLLAKIVTVIK